MCRDFLHVANLNKLENQTNFIINQYAIIYHPKYWY